MTWCNTDILPDSSCPDALHQVHGLVNVLGEDGSCETILGVVGPFQEILGVLEFDELLDGSENLS
jgi:hypothetical protein